MRLMINAANLRYGGGRSLALHLLEHYFALRPDVEVLLACPAGLGYEQIPHAGQVTIRTVPERYHRSYGYKYFYNRKKLPDWALEFGATKVVSLGNVAIDSLRLPQLVYIQLSHLLYPESPAWQRMPVKDYLVSRLMVAYITSHLRYAGAVAVQTAAMRDRFLARFGDHKPVHLLPNASAAPAGSLLHEVDPVITELRLLVPAAYYTHKNLEALIPLAGEIRKEQLPVRITLTLDASHVAAQRLLKSVEEQGLGDIICNAGYQSAEGLEVLWQRHNGMILPTLLESYSGAYPEAAARGKLIFTGNLDFATQMLGDGAFYFDPLSTGSMVKVLKQSLAQPGASQARIASALAWAQSQPDWPAVAAMFAELVDGLA